MGIVFRINQRNIFISGFVKFKTADERTAHARCARKPQCTDSLQRRFSGQFLENPQGVTFGVTARMAQIFKSGSILNTIINIFLHFTYTSNLISKFHPGLRTQYTKIALRMLDRKC